MGYFIFLIMIFVVIPFFMVRAKVKKTIFSALTDYIKSGNSQGFMHIFNRQKKLMSGKVRNELLFQTVEKGRVEILKSLIENGTNINARDAFGRTALILACMKGQTKIAEMLIHSGADIQAYDRDGFTAGTWAKNKDFSEISQLLRDRGAIETVDTVTSNYGFHNQKRLSTLRILYVIAAVLFTTLNIVSIYLLVFANEIKQVSFLSEDISPENIQLPDNGCIHFQITYTEITDCLNPSLFLCSNIQFSTGINEIDTLSENSVQSSVQLKSAGHPWGDSIEYVMGSGPKSIKQSADFKLRIPEKYAGRRMDITSSMLITYPGGGLYYGDSGFSYKNTEKTVYGKASMYVLTQKESDALARYHELTYSHADSLNFARRVSKTLWRHENGIDQISQEVTVYWVSTIVSMSCMIFSIAMIFVTGEKKKNTVLSYKV